MFSIIQGNNYIRDHEWTFYMFDALPILGKYSSPPSSVVANGTSNLGSFQLHPSWSSYSD